MTSASPLPAVESVGLDVRRRDERRAVAGPHQVVPAVPGHHRTVAWRLLVNRWRGVRRWLAARARRGPPDVAVGGPSPDRVAVLEALHRLPSSQRQVIALHYLLDMPVGEIAASTGTPVGTVKVRLSRARAALARLLGSFDEEDTDVASGA